MLPAGCEMSMPSARLDECSAVEPSLLASDACAGTAMPPFSPLRAERSEEEEEEAAEQQQRARHGAHHDARNLAAA